MTPRMALIPNHGEFGGVATEYRRVYQNIAFAQGKAWFSTGKMQCFDFPDTVTLDTVTLDTDFRDTDFRISHTGRHFGPPGRLDIALGSGQ